MTIKHLTHSLRWVGLPATFLTLGLVQLSVAAQDHCRVQLSRGWSQGAGKGTIVMRNDGKPCGIAMYSVPDASIPVDAIKVVSPPKNGAVSINVPRFSYTPNHGFTGNDRFELSAEGLDQERRQRIALKGEVTVRVDP